MTTGLPYVVDDTVEDVTSRDQLHDVIIDTAGNRPLSQLRRALAPRGMLVLVGRGPSRWPRRPRPSGTSMAVTRRGKVVVTLGVSGAA